MTRSDPPHALARKDAALACAVFALGFVVAEVTSLPGRRGGPAIEDEHVYLLQADLIAHGAVAERTPPLPEFFESAHVLLVPRRAPKYFPGNAIALAPFVRLSVPWLFPCVSLGAAVTLVFLILRLLKASRSGALAGAAVWLASPELIRWWGSYMSQPTASLFLLGATLTALLVRTRPTAPRVAALFSCAAMAGLTRPLSGVALLPLALLVLLRARPTWTALAAAAAPLVLAAAAALLFCSATTGSATTAPWSLYARQYMPFDGLGFGSEAETRPPERALPPHLARLAANYQASRAAHPLAALPRTALSRLRLLAAFAPSVAIWLFALLALPLLSRLLLPLGFAVLLFSAQLAMHWDEAFYLLEIYAALALVASAGVARLPELFTSASRLARAGLGLAAMVSLAQCGRGLARVLPALPERGTAYTDIYEQVNGALAPLAGTRSLVFLRYPPDWSANVDATQNGRDLAGQDVLRAIDLGPARDAELMRRMPDRSAYRLDLATLVLQRLEPR